MREAVIPQRRLIVLLGSIVAIGPLSIDTYLPAFPAMRDEMEASAALRGLLKRYTLAFHSQVTLTAGCNARHAIEQRLSRWLLIAHDRAGADEFPMTHEFMAMMLGVRRPGVSLAAGVLQKAGLIHYVRGRMAVTDRPGLEAASCECYHTARREFARLLGPAAATRPG